MTSGHRVFILVTALATAARFSPRDDRQCCYMCVCTRLECQSTRHGQYDSGTLCA